MLYVSQKVARSIFFPKPTFELIYSEAFANALDAEATKVKITIEIHGFCENETLRITIEDNGVGFTDKNYERFSNLFESKDKNHKGLGRLIYLQYFSEVLIESVFDGNKKRTFIYKEGSEDNSKLELLKNEQSNYSKLVFTNFSNDRLKSYVNIKPTAIKEYLLNQFLPRLYAIKQKGKDIELEIELKTAIPNKEREFFSGSTKMTLDDLPKLKEKKGVCPSIDMVKQDYSFLYLVEKEVFKESVTALCVDGRAMPLKILSANAIPQNVHAIFLLDSSFLDSKVNDSRDSLDIKTKDLESIKHLFLDEISAVLNNEVPEINIRNEEIKQRLSERFPHLSGLLPNNLVGLIDEDAALDYAQDIFFKQQKQILNASELSDDLYELSLNHAARVLTEYILYRNLTIKKIESITKEDDEGPIHNLIVPKRRIYKDNSFFDDLFNNNVWILDDKYMTYRSVLSDEELSKLIKEISEPDEKTNDKLRPDIAFVFSDNIKTANHPVDVVVVELKRRNESHLNNTRVIDQLEQRARRLLNYYQNKIQRMWFFGIIDFDRQIKTKFRESWYPLYSNGTAFFKEELLFPVDEQGEPIGDIKYPVAITALSYDALFKDAYARNEAFMRIIRTGIKRSSEKDK